jgi:hypothetical protein
VEPIQLINLREDDDLLKKAILDRISAFNSRLIAHERISSALQIVSVRAGSLPRTTVRNCYLTFVVNSLTIFAGEREHKVRELN